MSIPSSIADTALGLTMEELLMLRQEQMKAAAQAAAQVAQATKRAGAAARLMAYRDALIQQFADEIDARSCQPSSTATSMTPSRPSSLATSSRSSQPSSSRTSSVVYQQRIFLDPGSLSLLNAHVEHLMRTIQNRIDIVRIRSARLSYLPRVPFANKMRPAARLDR